MQYRLGGSPAGSIVILGDCIEGGECGADRRRRVVLDPLGERNSLGDSRTQLGDSVDDTQVGHALR